ncbi:hypothetical protein [Bradyrhizobium sp. NP1]|uniref:hypothetical protein n=1 Tax=Bradyrhizobium sp. NP1 TaxID=3049772 RepID=UPI0025A62958|nr:hypothetical protein [Bradyrhizobium sp. NP1]WJR80679.1 hypothetical protein QOU61_13235 [Bradyrhizobium sp. NP1]
MHETYHMQLNIFAFLRSLGPSRTSRSLGCRRMDLLNELSVRSIALVQPRNAPCRGTYHIQLFSSSHVLLG